MWVTGVVWDGYVWREIKEESIGSAYLDLEWTIWRGWFLYWRGIPVEEYRKFERENAEVIEVPIRKGSCVWFVKGKTREMIIRTGTSSAVMIVWLPEELWGVWEEYIQEAGVALLPQMGNTHSRYSLVCNGGLGGFCVGGMENPPNTTVVMGMILAAWGTRPSYELVLPGIMGFRVTEEWLEYMKREMEELPPYPEIACGLLGVWMQGVYEGRDEWVGERCGVERKKGTREAYGVGREVVEWMGEMEEENKIVLPNREVVDEFYYGHRRNEEWKKVKLVCPECGEKYAGMGIVCDGCLLPKDYGCKRCGRVVRTNRIGWRKSGELCTICKIETGLLAPVVCVGCKKELKRAEIVELVGRGMLVDKGGVYERKNGGLPKCLECKIYEERRQSRQCRGCTSYVEGYTDEEWEEGEELCGPCRKERVCCGCRKVCKGLSDEEWRRMPLCVDCKEEVMKRKLCRGCGRKVKMIERAWMLTRGLCRECRKGEEIGGDVEKYLVKVVQEEAEGQSLFLPDGSVVTTIGIERGTGYREVVECV